MEGSHTPNQASCTLLQWSHLRCQPIQGADLRTKGINQTLCELADGAPKTVHQDSVARRFRQQMPVAFGDFRKTFGFLDELDASVICQGIIGNISGGTQVGEWFHARIVISVLSPSCWRYPKEASLTPVRIALCFQTPMKKKADRKFPLLPGASHAPRPGGLGQLHQRCHAPAILGLRGLPEVNPHTLSLADLHFMCIPGLRSEARLANLVFSLVSTDVFFVSTFSELGAKCSLSHAASRPTDLETNPWIGGVKFVQKNLLCKWF